MPTKELSDKQLLGLFGEAVRSHRQTLGLSQEDLAFKCGLHRTYIGSVERGERNISLLNILKVAEALGCAPRELFKGIRR